MKSGKERWEWSPRDGGIETGNVRNGALRWRGMLDMQDERSIKGLIERECRQGDGFEDQWGMEI